MSDKNIPVDLKEAYLQEMQCEVILLREEVNRIFSVSDIRIGITQDQIEKHLSQANEALNKYTQAANLHFSSQKMEFKEIAEKELKSAIVEAHRELLKSNPPKMSLNNILLSILISAIVSGFVGFTLGIIAQRFY
ncbi:hypothetical protein ACN08N_00110 (plasmid) [Photobacterium leiognathi subsp. mandapamensis]|uniref:hypothetical protein n=1 Tax=Photobacterium leiognathi TaxID=553611 RepID=UPI003AF397A6